MTIHESSENYLEAILRLRERIGMVRSIDVVSELGFSKPSVSNAMKKLRESGHITMDAEGHILLTAQGEQVAQRIWMRHRTLTRLLVQLGVAEQIAKEDACKMEHDLSEESFAALHSLLHSLTQEA